MKEQRFPVSSSQVHDLTRLADSTRQIGQMREDWKRDATFMNARGLIHPGMRDRTVLEQFRNLRTRLLQRAGGDNPVTLVSALGQHGDSTRVALNLAIAFALDSAKTALLVDCHVGDARLHEVLGLEPAHGLTDYLLDEQMSISSILCQTGVPRLRLIAAGQDSETTSEFFTSLRMQAFLAAVKERYPDRFVILCAKPLDRAADSRILADLCEQALLVADYGRVEENRLLEAANIVGREKLAGVVLNRVPRPPFLER